MVEWAQRFGCPIHLHGADAQWVMRPDPAIRHWQGDSLELAHGLTLVRGGGHFPGGTVLHRAEGAGELLTGDIIQVIPDLSPWAQGATHLVPLPARTPWIAAAHRAFEFARSPARGPHVPPAKSLLRSRSLCAALRASSVRPGGYAEWLTHAFCLHPADDPTLSGRQPWSRLALCLGLAARRDLRVPHTAPLAGFWCVHRRAICRSLPS